MQATIMVYRECSGVRWWYKLVMIITCVICQWARQIELLWKIQWSTVNCRKSDSQYRAPLSV